MIVRAGVSMAQYRMPKPNLDEACGLFAHSANRSKLGSGRVIRQSEATYWMLASSLVFGGAEQPSNG